MTAQHDIVIIGSGISGLSAAWSLHKAGRDVLVLEASPNVGGAMQSEHREGYILEKGPFNVIARDPAFEELLGDFHEVVHVVGADKDAGAKRFVLRGDRLIRVPSNPVSLMTSPLLSFPARLRLLRGLMISRQGGAEDSIDDAAARRLGPEFASTLVSALISGIVAGDSRNLHLESCFPSLARMDRSIRSPLGFALSKAFARKKKKPRQYKGLISFQGGLGALPEAIAKRLGERILTNATVDEIEKIPSGFQVNYKHASRRETIQCQQLIIATGHNAAAKLLLNHSSDAADLSHSIPAASIVVMNLGFDEKSVAHPLQGYGFLVPRTETEYPLLGVLFADSVFPHHAPPGKRLIRVFMGGTRDAEAATKSESELLDIALPALNKVLGFKGGPSLVDICRYPSAIPQYQLGHNKKIKQLESIVSVTSGLHLAGNYLHGVSINDCVRSGRELATHILMQTSLNRHECESLGETTEAQREQMIRT